jgi:hypothetical protein
MRGCRTFAAVAIAVVALIPPSSRAQQPPDSRTAATPSRDDIRRELEKIKKTRTLTLLPAEGSDDSDGATVLRVENASPFDLVLLIVGPTTQRIQLAPERMQMLTVEPGDYELAVTVVTRGRRDVLPWYGRQKIVGGMAFRHKIVIPGA